MDRLIAEIRAALHASLFTLALQGSLALIDICGALGSENGRSEATRFKAWFEEHLGHMYEDLNADDMWELRNGILHQGRTKSKNHASVFFTLPNTMISVRQGAYDEAVSLDLVPFCETVLEAVAAWWAVQQDVEPVRTNAQRIVRIRPEGLLPHVHNIPVLA